MEYSGAGHQFASQQPISHYASQFSSQVSTSHYALPHPSISHHPGPGVYSFNIASIQATAYLSSLKTQGPRASSCENNNYMNGLSNDPSTQHFFHPSSAFCDPPAGLAKPGKRSSHRNVQKFPPANPYVRIFKGFRLFISHLFLHCHDKSKTDSTGRSEDPMFTCSPEDCGSTRWSKN